MMINETSAVAQESSASTGCCSQIMMYNTNNDYKIIIGIDDDKTEAG
jgi:hypothetical protein